MYMYALPFKVITDCVAYVMCELLPQELGKYCDAKLGN
jgi:hypothetical protein